MRKWEKNGCTKIVLLRMTFIKRVESFVMTYGLKLEKKRVYKNFCKIVHFNKIT